MQMISRVRSPFHGLAPEPLTIRISREAAIFPAFHSRTLSRQTTPSARWILTCASVRTPTRNPPGLISSVRKDGTGITATPPCYFECGSSAQSAPGTWPAFWVMTQDTYKGLQEPADELDIIEGYGGTGPHHPNQSGYWTTTHNWNQAGKQPGVYKQYPMTKFGGHSSWWETFHIYGWL